MIGAWDENLHPRDKGKFASKGGGGMSVAAWAKARQLNLPNVEKAKALPKNERDLGLKADWGLYALRKEGKLSKSVEEQHKIARDVISKHKEALPGHLEALKAAAPEGSIVQGRAKSKNSALEKIVRKPKYGDASNEGDVTGLRVITDDLKGVRDSVDKLKGRFKTHEDDDKITNPQGFYRSHHLGVTGDHGGAMELQVRTKRQHVIANEVHDAIYKPSTPEQKKLMAERAHEIEDHYKKMSDYALELDKGRHPKELGEPPAHPEWMRGIFPDIGEHVKDPSRYNFSAPHGYLLDEHHGHMQSQQETLKEDHPRYFKMDADTKDIPIDKITPTRAREKGIANAHTYMKGAYEGTHEKRDPISLEDQGDGTYAVMDGNSTYANAKKNGWKGIAAKVWAKGQWKDPKAH